MTIQGFRDAMLRWSALTAARSRVAITLSPFLREGIGRAGHARRFQWVRWLIPGSTAQISEEAVGFAEFVAARRPERICEIGTQHGGTSLFLCGLAPTLQTFVGIDVRIRNSSLVTALAPPKVQVAFLDGSSRDAVVRERLTSYLEGNLLDLLFIDGDHTYEGVRTDFLEYKDLVRNGGLIAFHDIRPDEGGAQVNRLAWSGDVPQFWQELRGRFSHWEFVRDPVQAGYGIGVIEHDSSVPL